MKDRTKAIISVYLFVYSLWGVFSVMTFISSYEDMKIDAKRQAEIKSGQCKYVDPTNKCYSQEEVDQILMEQYIEEKTKDHFNIEQ